MSNDKPQQKPARWHCNINGQEVGPLTDKQLRSLRQSGKLSRTDSIKKGADGKWVPAERIKGLFPDKITPKQLNDKAPTSAQPNTDIVATSAAPEVGSQRDKQINSLSNSDDQLNNTTQGAAGGSSKTIASETTQEDLFDTQTDPLNVDAGDVPILTASSYQSLTSTVAKPQTPTPNAAPNPKLSHLKWLAIGGGVGTLLLVALFGTLAFSMLGGENTEVAVVAPPSTPENSNERGLEIGSNERIDTDLQTATPTNTADASPEVLQDPPFADTTLATSEAAQSSFEDEVAISSNIQVQSLPQDKLGSESVSSSGLNVTAMTTDHATDAADSTESASARSEQSESSVEVRQGIEQDTQSGNEPEDVATSEVEQDAARSIGFGTVATTDKAEEVTAQPSQREAREADEANEAVKALTVMVHQRLNQIAERDGLGQEMEKNRQEFAAAMNAIRIATDELPKMQRQYQSLQDSRRELIAMRQTSKTPLTIDRTGKQLDAQMAQLQQAINQVSSTGNAALRAKPGIDRLWVEQNTRLASLQVQEGDVHSKLMETLDPFGHRSKKHREVLLDAATNWDSACVEGCLIRGLAELYEGKTQPALDDFASVIRRLEGVLRDKRSPKDSPERRILQVAFAGRGLAQFRLKKEPEAIKDLGKAIAVSDYYTFPTVLRGLVEVERSRHDAAMRDFEAARRLDNHHASREAARLLLTSATIANSKRALTFAEEACNRATSWSNHEVHAAALAANGAIELAEETYRKATDLAPTDQIQRIKAELAKLQ